MIVKTVCVKNGRETHKCFAMQMRPGSEDERRVIASVGYPLSGNFAVALVNGEESTSNPYVWESPAMRIAHHWLYQHFDEVNDGDTLDLGKITR